jgi:hypothetical protein
MLNERRATRQQIERAVGVLERDNSQRPIIYTLCDISRTGAKLKGNASNLAAEFRLILSADVKRWCRIVWRSDQHIGVRFICDPKISSPPSRLAEVMKRRMTSK